MSKAKVVGMKNIRGQLKKVLNRGVSEIKKVFEDSGALIRHSEDSTRQIHFESPYGFVDSFLGIESCYPLPVEYSASHKPSTLTLNNKKDRPSTKDTVQIQQELQCNIDQDKEDLDSLLSFLNENGQRASNVEKIPNGAIKISFDDLRKDRELVRVRV